MNSSRARGVSKLLARIRPCGAPIGDDERGAWRSLAHESGCERLIEGPRAIIAVSTGCERFTDPRTGAVTIALRADIANRGALDSQLDPAERSDVGRIAAAIERWGTGAPARIEGRWSFVHWDPRRDTLIAARDPSGRVPLHYVSVDGTIAIASDVGDLLASGIVAPRLDELFLAQVLVGWLAYHGSRTIHAPIERLCPAHLLEAGPAGLRTERYLAVEEVAPLRLGDRGAYLEAFETAFAAAVAEGIAGEPSLGTTLSGGLDSSSVAVEAAAQLARAGGRLPAFTAVPEHAVPGFAQGYFGDETEFVRAIAAQAGTIDLTLVDSAGVSPIAAMREMLALLHSPGHAPNSYFWHLALCRTAASQGLRRLFTANGGNSTMSWFGEPASQSLGDRWRMQGLRGLVPRAIVHAGRMRARGDLPESAIAPRFAQRIRLREQWLDDRSNWPRTPLERRIRHLKPGRSLRGEFVDAIERLTGIELYDPTTQPGFASFCLSVPDRIFLDPASGTDRWLIRTAMRGRLPDPVRLHRGRGVQSADIVARLRGHADEVEAELDAIETGPATEYLDIAALRGCWKRIMDGEEGVPILVATIEVLMRGMMAGIFVNGFGKLR